MFLKRLALLCGTRLQVRRYSPATSKLIFNLRVHCERNQILSPCSTAPYKTHDKLCPQAIRKYFGRESLNVSCLRNFGIFPGRVLFSLVCCRLTCSRPTFPFSLRAFRHTRALPADVSLCFKILTEAKVFVVFAIKYLFKYLSNYYKSTFTVLAI